MVPEYDWMTCTHKRSMGRRDGSLHDQVMVPDLHCIEIGTRIGGLLGDFFEFCILRTVVKY